jgi:hypothetical protein
MRMLVRCTCARDDGSGLAVRCIDQQCAHGVCAGERPKDVYRPAYSLGTRYRVTQKCALDSLITFWLPFSTQLPTAQGMKGALVYVDDGTLKLRIVDSSISIPINGQVCQSVEPGVRK